MNDSFRFSVRVYWEDTDGGGVVYYANYLKYLERARTEFLRSCGFEQSALQREQNLVFAVVSAQIDYLQPARLDDELRISVRLLYASRASLTFAQAICRTDRDETKICRAEVRVACLDASTFRPRRIPVAILEELH